MWFVSVPHACRERKTDRQTALFMVDAGIRMFYLLSCTSMWTLWGTLSFLVGRDFHIRGSCAAVAVRPSWLPGCYLQSLLQSRTYLIFCHAAPVSLAIAAVNPESCLFRSIAAVFVGLYALVCGPFSIIAHIIAYKCCSRLIEQEKMFNYEKVESSVTHSHRDFAAVYVHG